MYLLHWLLYLIIFYNSRNFSQKIVSSNEDQLLLTHQVTKLLKLYLYRVRKCNPKRVKFCQWLLTNYDNFFFTGEAWFMLDGYVNLQYYRVWLTGKLHSFIDKSLHVAKISVWWAVFQKQIVAPIFFEETVDSDIYYSIISQFIPLLEPN